MRTWLRTDMAAVTRCAIVLALIVHGRAWGAFALASGDAERMRTGQEPSFIAAIERERKLGQTTDPGPRPRTELSALLISRSRPIEDAGADAVPAQPPARCESEGGAREAGNRWSLAFLTVALALLSAAAFRRYRHRLKEET